MQTNKHFCSYLCQFVLEWKKCIPRRCRTNQKTHFTLNHVFSISFVTVEAIPLHQVIAGFTSSLLQHQRQYSAHIVLSCYPVRQSVSSKHNRWQDDRHRSFCALDLQVANCTERIKIVTHMQIFYSCLHSGAVGVLLSRWKWVSFYEGLCFTEFIQCLMRQSAACAAAQGNILRFFANCWCQKITCNIGTAQYCLPVYLKEKYKTQKKMSVVLGGGGQS